MHADTLGSIVAVTDNTGDVTDRFVYSPFGESANAPSSSFGFTGQRFDSETGLYFYKNRYYSTRTGRFLQPDPIGTTTDDLNLYTYVNNDPLNFVDPMGLQNQPSHGGAGSGKSGGGMSSGGPDSGGAGSGPGGPSRQENNYSQRSGKGFKPRFGYGPIAALILVIIAIVIVILVLWWIFQSLEKKSNLLGPCAA